MSELLLLDQEFKNIDTTYLSKTEALEELLIKYCDTMDSVVTEGVLQGESGNAFLAFSGMLRAILTTKLTEIMQDHNSATKQFLTNVFTDDEAIF